jgi:hypothetical protein
MQFRHGGVQNYATNVWQVCTEGHMSGTSRFVAYERVSTKRQVASGLGLEAKRKSIDIDDFVASRSAEVIARFTEVGERKAGGPVGVGESAAPGESYRGDPAHRQARPVVTERGLSADAPRQRRPLRRRRHAGGELPYRRDHGAGGRAEALGDLPPHEGGAGSRQGAGCASGQSRRRRCAATGW